MRPQRHAQLFDIILNANAQRLFWALSSGLIGIYLRSYQFSFAVLRLMQ
jgi:hypothetical protein